MINSNLATHDSSVAPPVRASGPDCIGQPFCGYLKVTVISGRVILRVSCGCLILTIDVDCCSLAIVRIEAWHGDVGSELTARFGSGSRGTTVAEGWRDRADAE